MKNTPDINAKLSTIQHLIRIKPVTFPYGLPKDESDYKHCFLNEHGEFVVRHSLLDRGQESEQAWSEVCEITSVCICEQALSEVCEVISVCICKQAWSEVCEVISVCICEQALSEICEVISVCVCEQVWNELCELISVYVYEQVSRVCAMICVCEQAWSGFKSYYPFPLK